MKVFCHIAPCNLLEGDRHFRRALCLHHQGDKLYETTGRNILEQSLSSSGARTPEDTKAVPKGPRFEQILRFYFYASLLQVLSFPPVMFFYFHTRVKT
jgi:hypothetical protein